MIVLRLVLLILLKKDNCFLRQKKICYFLFTLVVVLCWLELLRAFIETLNFLFCVVIERKIFLTRVVILLL